ncbi:putative transcriptional regulator [Salirhabdus euzebyi]|uniref:Putative transcriptional regulator n=1 Tax=Salirhabdus euzebyi TaxID=394506 RepID=A0A841PX92_9BACI|nr:putative transcriptional regulator [Salirhabdus euzebyi]
MAKNKSYEMTPSLARKLLTDKNVYLTKKGKRLLRSYANKI